MLGFADALPNLQNLLQNLCEKLARALDSEVRSETPQTFANSVLKLGKLLQLMGREAEAIEAG
ncbi:hypothetical protein CP500_016655 [Tychonema bourrellyi FEM_GT703]|uniref:Tetratricopeptide repeat-containing protein n=1 Tax=Tychonema bourrellyi FEM_GT703 TaxID=2040638 RepID=A0A2G4EXT0_9CYAN|nr:hypothetical protein CP500_016655 [Tychonema bourrellyi FEM_GT703]